MVNGKKILTGATFFLTWIAISPSFWPARYAVSYTSGQSRIPDTLEWLTWGLSPNAIGSSFRSYILTNHPEAMIRYLAAIIVSIVFASIVDMNKVFFWFKTKLNRVNHKPNIVYVEKDYSFNSNTENRPQTNRPNYESTPVQKTGSAQTTTEDKDPYAIEVFKSVTLLEGSGEKSANIKKFSGLVGKKIPRTMVTLEKLQYVRYLLEAEYPWLKSLTNEALTAMEVQCRIKGDSVPMELPSILVLGPPGVGKTDWSRRFSELFGSAHRIFTLGGKNSSATIRSSERIWSNAGPSSLISTILQENSSNPLIVLDEIDKVGSGSSNGNVQDTLLQLLEKASSKAVYDDFLEGVTDLSGIQWLATANDKNNISEPLFNRFRVVTVNCPEPQYAKPIAESVKKRIASEWHIKDTDLPRIELEPEVKRLLENGKSLRDIHRTVLDAYSRIIKS